MQSSKKDLLIYTKNKPLPEFKESLPPDNNPTGKVPDGVKPFNSNTLSLSSLKQEKKT